MKRNVALLLILIAAFSLWRPSSSVAQQDADSTFVLTTDAAFSVILPDGWFIEGDRESGLVVANHKDTDMVEVGNMTLRATALSYAEASQMTGVGENAPLADFLEILGEILSAQITETPTVSDVRETTFLDRPIATSVLTTSEWEVMLVLYEIAPDTLNYANIVGGEGMINDQGKQVLEIVDSIRYSLPLDAMYQDDDYEFPYPSDWNVEKTIIDIIFIANFTDVLGTTDLEPGEYGFAVLNPQNLEVDEDNLQDTIVELAHSLWPENEELSPITITVNGQEIVFADVQDFGTTTNVGGIMVRALDDEFVAVFHIASVGEAESLWLTALNILLNIE